MKNMRKQSFNTWMIGTIVLVALCGGLGYVSYLALYPPIVNWFGYPTQAQEDEFFAFAEKIGYLPHNELGFNERSCSGIPANCGMILIFAVDQPLKEINHIDLNITRMEDSASRPRSLMGAFRGAKATLILDGKTSSDVPAPPDYPSTGWSSIDTTTNEVWHFASYRTSEYAYSVEINGVPEHRDFVIIRQGIK